MLKEIQNGVGSERLAAPRVNGVEKSGRSGLDQANGAAYALIEAKEAQLRKITDATPVMFAQCSRDRRFLFVNQAYAARFGLNPDEIVGRKISEILGHQAYQRICPYIARVLKGERLDYETEIPYQKLGLRRVQVSYSPDMNQRGEPAGWIATVTDITERKQAEEELQAVKDRLALELAGMRRLHVLSTSLLDQSEIESLLHQVLEATLELTRTARGTIQLWDEEKSLLRLAAHIGFGEDFLRNFETVRPGEAVCGQAFQQRKRVVVENISTDQRFAEIRKRMARYGIAAVQSTPLMGSDGRVLGVLSTHFRKPKVLSDRQFQLLDLFVQQAVRVIERKNGERALARRARQQAVLYRFTNQLHRSSSETRLYDAALQAISAALGCSRSAILLSDAAGVMRFVAWRGLSESYRKAVEGHSPWKPDETKPQIVTIRSVEQADLSPELKKVVLGEGIHALAFIPLVANKRLIGKFMTYHDSPHAFTREETSLSLTIARQLAVGIERKRAEEATRRLAAIVESSDDAMISKNLDSTITSWNSGAERLFGYAAREAIGQPVTMLIPSSLRHEEPRILRALRRGERIENYETVRQRKDGSLVDISLTVSPIRNAAGQVIGASKVARDITDKKRAREKLEQTVAERTAQLRDTIAELEAFSYSIAHDMRAPLRAMQGFAHMLEEDCGPQINADGKEYLRRIAASANRLDALIQDVLDYSKIMRADLPLEPVNTEDFLRDILLSYPNLQPPLARIEIQNPIPALRANPAALTQVLSNLLGNAAKFVKPGVQPHVRVWAETRPGPMVRVWIEDNGIGIRPAMQNRIFMMFQRLNPHGRYEGTGIGLTVARKAIERMGGRIGLESEEGKGSRFWIELEPTRISC